MKLILRIINFLYKNKFKISIIIFILIILIGFIGNYFFNCKKIGFWKSLLDTLSLFGLNTPNNINSFTIIAFFLTYLFLFGNFIFFIFKEKFDILFTKSLLKDKNIVLFGFGEINKKILENLTTENIQTNIVIVDKEAKDFDEFWEKGCVFLKREINNELINKFDFDKTTDIIVALGSDRLNIDISLKLIDKLKNLKNETKLIVHLNDREMNDIFFDKLEEIKQEEKKELLINVKTFSFYTEVADDLFEKYDIKLVPYEYAKFDSTKKELKISIIGNSDVTLEIIRKIFVNFIFPNEVRIKIFLIDKDEKEFYERVKFETNYTPQKFPHIILESKHLDYELLTNKNFWLQDDLIDIIVAFNSEDKNLEIIIDLFEKIFIHQDNIEYPNIFFAMYQELAFSNYIDANKKNFRNFFTFGNIKEILSIKNLLDDEKFNIAKQIHYGYGTKYRKNEIILDKDKLNKKWFKSAKYSDKLSNIAQYEHIPYKLLSLGLYKFQNNNKNKENILKDNQQILFSKLKHLGMIDENLIFKFSCEVEKSYDKKLNYQFDKNIVDEFFKKFIDSEKFYNLINTEHRRWVAYHYLNGWEYADKKDKIRKKHNCLVDISDFTDYSRRLTVIYDIYSYLYLPNYLAAAGYEIKP